MPSFDLQKVEVLFSLSLIKAQAEMNRQGFEKLSSSLLKKYSDSEITSEYIYKYIHRQVLERKKDKKTEIPLRQTHIDRFAKYLSFDTFDDFQAEYNHLSDYLSSISSNDEDKLPIMTMMNSTSSLSFDQLKKMVSYPTQVIEIQEKPLDSTSDTFLEATYNTVHQSFFSLLMMENNDLESFNDTFSQALNQHDSFAKVCLVCVDTAGKEMLQKRIPNGQKANILLLEELPFLIQVATVFQKKATLQQTADSAQAVTTRPTNHIQDVGTVVLGSIKQVKGKYISSRDMHISIQNDKKN